MGKTLPRRAQVIVPIEKIADFCRRWGVVELALFGSVLRDDFRADSDVDVLVTLGPAGISLDDWIVMRDELTLLFGREVDLVDRASSAPGCSCRTLPRRRRR